METSLEKNQTVETAAPREPEQWRKPSYRVRNDAEAVHLEVDMPGVSKDGYSVTLDRAQLSIQGKRTIERPEGIRRHRVEMRDYPYRLQLQLNVEVDGDAITARSEQGVLRVTLPIAAAAKPRRIAISD